MEIADLVEDRLDREAALAVQEAPGMSAQRVSVGTRLIERRAEGSSTAARPSEMERMQPLTASLSPS